MNINTKNIVSITEANQNFSLVARLVDENGAAVILKNNVPRYLVVEFSQAEQEQRSDDEDVLAISKRLIRGQSPGSQATRTVLAFCTSITNSWPSAGSQIQQPQRTEAAGLAAFFCYGAKDFKEMGEIPIDRKEKVWYSFKAVK